MVQKKMTGLFCVLILMVSSAMAGEIQWAGPPANIVKHSVGFESVKTVDKSWQGTTLNPVYPRIFLGGLNIDADANKYLYLKLSARDRLMRIFFSDTDDGQFFNNQRFRTAEVSLPDQLVIYRLNLSEIARFSGIIRAVRIDFIGHERGDTIIFDKLGVSSKSLDQIDGQQVKELSIDATPYSHERMASWQDTMVRTDQTTCNSGLFTYIRDQATFTDQYLLAKLAVGVETDDGVVWTDALNRPQVEDFPGGVRADFDLGDTQVTTKFTALLEGQDTPDWIGAAVYEVKSDPPRPLRVRIGGGMRINMNVNTFAGPWMRDPNAKFEGAAVEVDQTRALFTSSAHPLTVGLKTTEWFEIKTPENAGQYVEVRFQKGTGAILLTFAKEKEKVNELLELYPQHSVKKVNTYYDHLLTKCRIETPEQTINDAFRQAIVTMDYSWYWPYGWIESPHHWLATFHLQHSGGEAWIGRTDRVRTSLLSHAKNLRPSGAVPNFILDTVIDGIFGGSDQYYFWQIAEYLKYTDDVETIKKLAPAMDKVLYLIKRRYDPDDDGLFAWGLQIGNQEDMIATPYNGTAPTIEAINMMRTRAMVARRFGDEDTVQRMEKDIRRSLSQLHEKLWMKDLGRFMYFYDPSGQPRLDSQYHSFIYPVIFTIVDELDGWTSMRHLRDRLMGKLGEIYLSNNFPDHLEDIWATWGMQAGAAQQPWGAWGLAAMGLRNETYLPLKVISDVVMDEPQKGSWPEVMYEDRMGYFSPPAGLFIQAVIEALYGLKLNRPQGYLEIAPSFPDHWNEASLHLPDFAAEYRRKGNMLSYSVTSSDKLPRKLRWILPVSKIKHVKVNGKKINYHIQPYVNSIIIEADIPAQAQTDLQIVISPIKFAVDCPASIAESQPFELKTKSVTIEGVDDRCGVLSLINIKNDNRLSAVIQKGLLAPYMQFGRLGQMNFSRRSFFLDCQTPDGISFWYPVDLLILPPYEASVKNIQAKEEKLQANVLIRNNTQKSVAGNTFLEICNTSTPFNIQLDKRSQKEFFIDIPKAAIRYLSPGDNQAVLVLPNDQSLDLKYVASSSLLKNKQSPIVTEPIPLPPDKMISGAQWRSIRQIYFNLHNPDEVLSGWPKEVFDLNIPELPAVTFKIDQRKFVPISMHSGQMQFTLAIEPAIYKKLYFLIIPFIESHEIFSEIGQIYIDVDSSTQSPQITNVPIGSAEGSLATEPSKSPQIGKALITRRLFSPGDVDCWFPASYMGHLGSFKKPRSDRFSLLPIRDTRDSDWPQAKPPAFPQDNLWVSSLAVDAGNSVLNVIEIDLVRPRTVKAITFRTVGTDAAFGLVAITAEKPVEKQTHQEKD